MIISASRRTDIPAYYSEWLMNRLKEGWLLVPEPRNPHKLRRLSLSPEQVDAFVFWTKNPSPMLERLDELDAFGYPYYFQFTLTPYDRKLERNLPEKSQLLRAFQRLSARLGPERVVWRYDPIILQGEWTLNYHTKAFQRLAGELEGCTDQCIISFLDLYARRMPGAKGLADRELSIKSMREVAAALAPIAERYGFRLSTCAETAGLQEFGVTHASCIDPDRMERLLGCPVRRKKDPGQRPECKCMESVDIGVYDTCGNGCAYCYATTSIAAVQRNMRRHHPASPMLPGWPSPESTISFKELESIKIEQTSLF